MKQQVYNLILILFTSQWIGITKCIQVIDPRPLSNQVYSLLEKSSKRGEIQSYIDAIPQKKEYKTSADLDEIFKIVEDKFRLRLEVAKNFENTLKKAYSTGTTLLSLKQCCENKNFVFDSRFGRKVNTSDMCIISFANATIREKVDVSIIIKAAMENLKTVSSLRWQYFGTYENHVIMYPSFELSACVLPSYIDYRIRPWYVQAISTAVKHLIILIDTSGSMAKLSNGTSKLDIAKLLTRYVIETLNPHDEFTVISFANMANTLGVAEENPPCFSYTFAKATPRNQQDVYLLLDDLVARGGISYHRVFERSFEFMKQYREIITTGHDKCVILMISDGSSEETLTKIYEPFEKAKNDGEPVENYIIAMFGVGTGEFPIMRDLALNNPYSNQNGLFDTISKESEAINRVAHFYEFISDNSSVVRNPIWTVPYKDGFNDGELVSLSMPIFKDTSFLGVFSMDMNTEVLFAPLSYFRPNKLSYSFLLDKRGLVVVHPLLYDEDAGLTDRYASATSVERDAEFLPVLEGMLNGTDGETSFLASKVLFENANNLGRNQKIVKVNSTYIWKSIPNVTFSICFVLSDKGSYLTFTYNQSIAPGTFLHHRVDLIRPKVPCYHLNVSAADESAVYFSPRSFFDPEEHLIRDYTAADIREISNYLENNGPNTFKLKPQAKQDVAITQEAARLWSSDIDTDLQRYVLWLYISTENGVLRGYPGSFLPKTFHPVATIWYRSALLEPDKDVVTVPYADLHIGISVITFCRALLRRGKNQVGSNEFDNSVYGVVAVDLIYSYFYEIVHNLYGEWLSERNYGLRLVDLGGFVILAEEYINGEVNKVLHLTELEPAISRALIDAKILLRDNCSAQNGFLERRYIIILRQNSHTGSIPYGPGLCHEFAILRVPGTNFFILIRTLIAELLCTSDRFQSAACVCSTEQCTTFWEENDSECECPCKGSNPLFNPCTNDYELDSPYICSIQRNLVGTLTLKTAFTPKFPQCYSILFEYASDRRIHSIFLIIVLCLFFTSSVTLSYFFNRNFDRRLKQKEKEKALKEVVEIQASNVEGYLAKILQNNNNDAKEALYRVAAFLRKLQHKPNVISSDELKPLEKFPPNRFNESLSSNLRFNEEASFVAESISYILHDAEFSQLLDSETVMSSLKQNKLSQPNTGDPDLNNGSSTDFEERSLSLLRSLMTLSILSLFTTTTSVDKWKKKLEKKPSKTSFKSSNKSSKSASSKGSLSVKQASMLSKEIKSPGQQASLNVPEETF